MQLFLSLPLLAAMVAAVATDFRAQKIPNLITLPLMLYGLCYHVITSGFSGLSFSFLGIITGIGIFIIPYIMGGMGAGDAKLMGGAGALIGAKGAFISGIFSILLGLVYAVILLVIYSKYGIGFIKNTG